MKNILTILAELGVDVPSEKEGDLKKAMNENYRTIADYNNQKEKLDNAVRASNDKDATIDDLNTKLKDADASEATIQAMQKTIDDYKTADENRKAQEAAEAKQRAFDPKFTEALGDRKFSNTFTEEAVKAKAFEISAANPAMSVSQIIDDLTKDTEGVFSNPNRPNPNQLPKPNGGGSGKLDIRTREDVQKLSAQQINENWEQVSKILKQ